MTPPPHHLIAAVCVAAASALLLSCDASGWTVNVDFEQGAVGQRAQGNSGLNEAFKQTTYSNAVVHTGKQSAEVKFVQGSEAWGISGGVVSYPSPVREGGELWARGYFYFKSPWAWKCTPVAKMFRAVHVTRANGSNVGYASLLCDDVGAIVAGNEANNTQVTTGASFDVDQWQYVEVYVKFSATKGVMRAWKNGALIYEDVMHATLSSPTDAADCSYIFTYWNGGVPQNQTAYIDDFVYTTEQPVSKDAKGNPMIGGIAGGVGASGR